MPDLIRARCGRLAGACALLALLFAAPRADAEVQVGLRVEGPGETLERGSAFIAGGEQRIDRARGLECNDRGGTFGVRSATPLGLPQAASRPNPDLIPVTARRDRATDQLFTCAIGGFVGQPFDSGTGEFSGWTYRVDHEFRGESADALRLRSSDDVLWTFISNVGGETVNLGPELLLKAPPRADANGEVDVTAYEFNFDGERVPAQGVTISGGAQPAPPTDAAGESTVAVEAGFSTLRGTRDADAAIPSNRVEVCFREGAGECPTAHGEDIFGSPRDDGIDGTRGWDGVEAAAGDDRIDLRDGGEDRVDCGAGRDVVVLEPGDRDDEIAGDCERKVRR